MGLLILTILIHYSLEVTQFQTKFQRPSLETADRRPSTCLTYGVREGFHLNIKSHRRMFCIGIYLIQYTWASGSYLDEEKCDKPARPQHKGFQAYTFTFG